MNTKNLADIDFIPTEEYSEDDAEKTIADTKFIVKIARNLIPG